MRVFHFSDTHLGYQAFDVVNAQSINAREQDMYDAFERVVERILALRGRTAGELTQAAHVEEGSPTFATATAGKQSFA